MSQFTQKNNIDLFAARQHGAVYQAPNRRFTYHLWEDVTLADLTPYQLGAAFSVNNCISISIQVSILVNPAIVAVRNSALGAQTYAAAVAAPQGFEITNGEVLSFESDEDPETGGYIYLQAKDYWIMSLISDALTGCAVHISYGVLP